MKRALAPWPGMGGAASIGPCGMNCNPRLGQPSFRTAPRELGADWQLPSTAVYCRAEESSAFIWEDPLTSRCRRDERRNTTRIASSSGSSSGAGYSCLRA
jgi:hypothetical protein